MLGLDLRGRLLLIDLGKALRGIGLIVGDDV